MRIDMHIFNLLFLLLSSCSKCETLYDIKILNANPEDEVILIIDSESQLVQQVQLPMYFKVKNNCAIYQTLVSIDYSYKYSDSIRGRSPHFEIIREDVLKVKFYSKSIEVNKNDSLIVSIKTKHRIKDWDYLQQTFEQQVATTESDTILVGNLKTFKSKYQRIFNSLVKGNQLDITYLNNSGEWSYYKIPIDL